MECWPRNVDMTAAGAKPYPGWPMTIGQADNYGRRAAAHLPALKVAGMEDPVVQVVDESSGEIVYTLRIKGHDSDPRCSTRAAIRSASATRASGPGN